MQESRRRVLISLKTMKSHIVAVGEGHSKVPGLGVIDTAVFSELPAGSVFEICGEPFVVLSSPSLAETLSSAERRAQIITVKDIGPIVARLGVMPGHRVVEIGAGSGNLTMALAYFVGAAGRVTTHEVERESIALVSRNLERVGLSARVTFVEGDASPCRGDGQADALVADVPNPWAMLDFAESSLRPGGQAAFYTPSTNQVERLVKELRRRGWAGDFSMETLERQMVVGEMGLRPSFDMLGHTGYLTFARWLGTQAAERLAQK
jgi:tRNA (adenine57-N1/adenine58-N1)-methyltransferase